MSKKVVAVVKLQIPAGQAKAGPPIGPALAQHKLNIMDFCKQFNARTGDLKAGEPTPVEISVYVDKTFDFVTKTPPASYLIRQEIGIAKGASRPGHDKAVGVLSLDGLKNVAQKKMPDLNCYDLEGAMRIVSGTARSMNVDVAQGD